MASLPCGFGPPRRSADPFRGDRAHGFAPNPSVLDGRADSVVSRTRPFHARNPPCAGASRAPSADIELATPSLPWPSGYRTKAFPMGQTPCKRRESGCRCRLQRSACFGTVRYPLGTRVWSALRAQARTFGPALGPTAHARNRAIGEPRSTSASPTLLTTAAISCGANHGFSASSPRHVQPVCTVTRARTQNPSRARGSSCALRPPVSARGSSFPHPPDCGSRAFRRVR